MYELYRYAGRQERQRKEGVNVIYLLMTRVMRSAINEGQKARYLESKNVSIYESELQKKHPF